MVDFVNKIFTIILLFLTLVIGPISWSYVRGDMIAERTALNEINSFIDKVTDKASLTEQDIDELALAVNSSGAVFDIDVKVYVRSAVPSTDPTQQPKTVYIRSNGAGNEPYPNLVMGDTVKVSLKEVGRSPAKRLLWAVLRVDSGSTNLTLAGTVR